MAMANLQFPRIEYEFDVAMLMVMNTLRRTTIALLLSGLHDTTTKQPLSGLVIDFISFHFISLHLGWASYNVCVNRMRQNIAQTSSSPY